MERMEKRGWERQTGVIHDWACVRAVRAYGTYVSGWMCQKWMGRGGNGNRSIGGHTVLRKFDWNAAIDAQAKSAYHLIPYILRNHSTPQHQLRI